MENYRIKVLVLLLIILVSVCNTFAWGRTGHQLVADIAGSIMNENVKENVQKYLGNTSFEDAAEWMDEVRSQNKDDYMKPWHYINIEKDGEYVPGNGDNIIDRFNITYRELQHKKTLNNETIKTDLLLIFHLVGKQLTSYKTIKTDLVNAGAYWKDGEVLVDNGLITSRSPKDIPAFCKKMIEEIEEEIHA